MRTPHGSTFDGEAASRAGEALRPLDGLAERPLPEHVAAFDDVHRRLQAILANPDRAG